MVIGTNKETTRDRVRDQRIDRIVELVAPEALLGEWPLGEERAKAVVRGREEVVAVLDRSDDRLLVVVGPCSVHDPAAALDYAQRLAEKAEELERRPADRDARLLREAAHHDRLEGADQRPPPRRLGRRQRRPAHSAHAAARGARPRPAGRLRVPRPDHPAVHLRRGRLGRDRRAHDREPDPPPARLRPLDADRVQEPHRRQRPGRGRRGSRRRGAARLRGHRRHRRAGDPPHHRQPRRPRDPARRQGGSQLRRCGRRRRAREAARRRAARAAGDRRLPRQQRQGSRRARPRRRWRWRPRSRPATGRSSG